MVKSSISKDLMVLNVFTYFLIFSNRLLCGLQIIVNQEIHCCVNSNLQSINMWIVVSIFDIQIDCEIFFQGIYMFSQLLHDPICPIHGGGLLSNILRAFKTSSIMVNLLLIISNTIDFVGTQCIFEPSLPFLYHLFYLTCGHVCCLYVSCHHLFKRRPHLEQTVQHQEIGPKPHGHSCKLGGCTL